MIDNKCVYPRGRGLGGSTLINGLIYSRGNRLDYDKWAEMGNTEWAYEKVLPYFKKSENFSFGNDIYRGRKGPWHVEYNRPRTVYEDMFIEANEELDREVVDYNGEQEFGVGYPQFNMLYGRRDDIAKAFLLPVANRTNLRVQTESYATKILMENSTNTAYAVNFMYNGKKYVARANREIIISAGALISPQLLMLSGIGPAEHLKTLNIPVYQDLPVGKNLMEHVGLYELNFVMDYNETSKSVEENVREFLQGYGSFAVPGSNLGLTFTRLDGAEDDVPDFEFAITPSKGTDVLTQISSNLKNETYKGLYGSLDGRQFFQINLFMLHPHSRGSIKLASADPFDYPLIDPNLLSDEDDYDIEMVYNGVQLVLELLETESFKKWNVQFVPPKLPACESYEVYSKNFWYCVIRQLAMGANHTLGTNKMGPDSKDSVVDSKLRVHGTKKLRVIDTGVIPVFISGHITPPTVMVAEMGSDFIKSTMR